MLKLNQHPPVPGSVELTSHVTNPQKWEKVRYIDRWPYADLLGGYAADLLLNDGAKETDLPIIGSELSAQLLEAGNTEDVTACFNRGFNRRTSEQFEGVTA